MVMDEALIAVSLTGRDGNFLDAVVPIVMSQVISKKCTGPVYSDGVDSWECFGSMEGMDGPR